MNNMILSRNILIHIQLITKIGAKRSRNAKFCESVIALTILVGALCLSPVFSSLMNSVVIKSSGEISTSTLTITAKSGYWRDIQEAVDWIVAHGGLGNVYIPDGNWNFTNPGETWIGARVVIPAGVNLFGAPTERDINDQVIEWKTVLIMPSDVLGNDAIGIPTWFKIGNEYSSVNRFTRFSDIKLVGYRTFDESSTSMHVGVRVECVLNFRIDHCCFFNTAGGGVQAVGSSLRDGPDTVSGVIDHCKFVNTVGVYAPYDQRTVSYGVYASRGGGWEFDLQPWEEDITKILGKYLDYTVFVEDCYFEKWRHCAVCRLGAHLVMRYSTIKYDYGYGSVDIHGDAPGRALEIYNCILEDSSPYKEAVWYRAGGGVVFNNTVKGYNTFLYLTDENSNSKFHVKNLWIWNNTLGTRVTYVTSAGPVQDQDYFMSAPSWYTRYTYPHPLTLK